MPHDDSWIYRGTTIDPGLETRRFLVTLINSSEVHPNAPVRLEIIVEPGGRLIIDGESLTNGFIRGVPAYSRYGYSDPLSCQPETKGYRIGINGRRFEGGQPFEVVVRLTPNPR